MPSSTGFHIDMITIPHEEHFTIHVSASTRYCLYCDNTGYETYTVDGKQGVTRCPNCVNRERGVPIPYGDLGLPIPIMEKL